MVIHRILDLGGKAAAWTSIACGLVLLTVGASLAGGPNQSAPTASLGVSSADPSFGHSMAMTANYSSFKGVPEMSISCTQNGKNVYLNVQTNSGSSPWTTNWTLWSQAWANSGGGSADCTAQLYYYVWQGKTETGVVYLASSTFTTT